MLGAETFIGVWLFMSSPSTSGTKMGDAFQPLNYTLLFAVDLRATLDGRLHQPRKTGRDSRFAFSDSAIGSRIVIGKSSIQAPGNDAGFGCDARSGSPFPLRRYCSARRGWLWLFT